MAQQNTVRRPNGTTVGVYFRPIRRVDVERLHAIRSSEGTFSQKFTNFVASTETLEMTRDWVERLSLEVDTVRHAICRRDTHQLIGCGTLAKIDYENRTCELHVYIDGKSQGRGFGTAALALMIDYARHIASLRHICLDVHRDHAIARRLYEKHGFQYCPTAHPDLLRMKLFLGRGCAEHESQDPAADTPTVPQPCFGHRCTSLHT